MVDSMSEPLDERYRDLVMEWAVVQPFTSRRW